MPHVDASPATEHANKARGTTQRGDEVDLEDYAAGVVVVLARNIGRVLSCLD